MNLWSVACPWDNVRHRAEVVPAVRRASRLRSLWLNLRSISEDTLALCCRHQRRGCSLLPTTRRRVPLAVAVSVKHRISLGNPSRHDGEGLDATVEAVTQGTGLPRGASSDTPLPRHMSREKGQTSSFREEARSQNILPNTLPIPTQCRARPFEPIP